MISIVKKIFRGFIYSLHGLYTAYTREQSIRVEVWGGLFLVVVAYAAWPLAVYEILFLVLGYIMILAMELINTSIETVWEKIHPEFHELVGASKDIASAAVLLAIVFTFIVVAVIAMVRVGILS